MARRAFYLEQSKKTYSGIPIIQLDAGNLFDGYGMPKNIENEAMIEAMNRMGVFACNVSSEDLFAGLEKFKEVTSKARFPFFSASFIYTDTETLVFPPYVTFQAGSYPIAVIGIDYTASTATIKGEKGRTIKRLKPEDAVLRVMPTLQMKGYSLLVLAHSPRYAVDGVRRRFPEILTSFFAARGEAVEEGKVEKDLKIAPVGYWGMFLTELRAYVQTGGGVRTEIEVHSLDPRISSEPGIQALVTQARDQVKRLAREQRAKPSEPDAGAVNSGPSVCQSCHCDQYDAWTQSAHTRALESLKGEDKNNRECLKCHAARSGESTVQEPASEGVECEACHGNGKMHVLSQTPGYGKVSPWRCLVCHDRKNSPAFDRDVYLEKIKH